MGKFFTAKVANHYLYYTSFDRHEPVHAHASDRKMIEAGSAKIWVLKDGSTEVASPDGQGRLSAKELNTIRKYITDNHITIFRMWENAFGPLWIKGEPDKRYTIAGGELEEV